MIDWNIQITDMHSQQIHKKNIEIEMKHKEKKNEKLTKSLMRIAILIVN